MTHNKGQQCKHLECQKYALEQNIDELVSAVKSQHDAIDILFAMLIARTKDFYPSESGKPWEAMKLGQQALKNAKGGNS